MRSDFDAHAAHGQRLQQAAIGHRGLPVVGDGRCDQLGDQLAGCTGGDRAGVVAKLPIDQAAKRRDRQCLRWIRCDGHCAA